MSSSVCLSKWCTLFLLFNTSAIKHVSWILVLREAELGVGVELSNGRKVDVTTEDGDSKRLVDSKVLQVFNHDRSLLFVVLGGPVVVQVVQDFNATVNVVKSLTKDTGASERFHRIHKSGCQAIVRGLLIVVRIRSISVKNVMVIPHIDHGDLRACKTEQPLGEPHAISLKVEVLQLSLHVRSESGSVLMDRVANVKPLFEEATFFRDTVVVDLVTTTNHKMERSALVVVEHIAPHGVGAAQLIRLHAHAEAVAAVEHHVHRLGLSGYPETCSRSAVDAIRDALLLITELNLDIEAPESASTFRV
ncbi:hypothetical protein HG530_008329 [Fusarium avenaceum]|nr:hypothetical protein HG530_008329 [Fusarium avenaceum]